MEKRILIGMHNVALMREWVRLGESRGYRVDSVEEFEDILKKARENRYEMYLMDLTFGRPGSNDITPARTIYDLVAERVKSGEARFLGLSNDNALVNDARAHGIPSELTGDMTFKIAEMLV